MKSTQPFPYPEGLTQLDIELTDLEREVATDENFQAIRRQGFPKWGLAATGISYKNDGGHNLYKLVHDPLTPNAARLIASEYASWHIGLVRLTAKAMRDYAGSEELTGYHDSEFADNNPDGRLIRDLIRWQDAPDEFRNFRWEERWHLLQGWKSKDDWERAVAEFRSDGKSSDLIVLLLRDLVRNKVTGHEGLYNQLTASCKEYLNLPSDAKRSSLVRHLPYSYCCNCWWESHSDQIYHSGPSHVRAIPMVDCGDTAQAKSWIGSTSLRRTIKQARFVIPHSSFDDCDSSKEMFAGLLIFDLTNFSGKTRQMIFDRLSRWVEVCRQDEIRRNQENASDPHIPQWDCWANTVVLKPAGKQQMRAIVVAGPSVEGSNFQDAFHEDEFVGLINEGLIVTSTCRPNT